MEKKLAKMKNHYIICGCGAVGHDVIRKFLRAEQKHMLIDKEEIVLNKLIGERPDTPIHASDVLIVFGSNEQVKKLRSVCRQKR